MSEKPLLAAQNLTRVFKIGGGLGLISRKLIKAVDDVSFVLPNEPKITALVGESGSGKTTIARLILGLVEPTSGELLYNGMNVQSILRKDWRTYRREVQAIFQDPYGIYNPFYKVERPLKIVARRLALASKKEVDSLVVEALEAIGLRPEDILGRYPHQLSGGERQRIMLARILLVKPRLVIADEPVSMIDVSLRAIFSGTLREFKEKHNISCLYITHDLNIAYYVCDRIIVLCGGRVIEEGDAESVVRDPLHPYTQFLVDSIPIPNPYKRWDKELGELAELKGEHGCIFYERCPHATDTCSKERVPLKEVEGNRKVACHRC